MPLVNTSIPNLAQGVSQQPDNLRFAGQHEAQENMFSSVVDGLRKRPFTEFVGELGTDVAIDPNSFVHLINRDSSNRHLLVIEPGSTAPKIYDTADGSLINTYAASTGTGTPDIAYINEANPRENLRALTVADTTFILNKTQTISALGTDSTTQANKAMVFVKQGDYVKDYNVDISVGGTKYHCTYKTGDGVSAAATINGAAIAANDHGTASGNAEDASSELIAQGLFGAITGSLSSSSILDDFTITLADLEGATGTPANDFSAATNGNAVLIEYHGQAQVDTITLTGGGVGDTFDVTIDGNSLTDGPVDFDTNLDTTVTNLADAINADSALNGIVTATVWSGDLFLTANTKGTAFTASSTPVDNGGGAATTDQTTTPNIAANTLEVTVHDGVGDNGLGVVYKEVSSITDLPIKAFHDLTVKVTGDVELAADDYYVKFVEGSANPSADDYGDGKWVETIAPDTPTALTATDMPYKLEPQPGLSTYYIATNTWGTRLVGDTETNPAPSFVSTATETRTIENIFFWKNRLGFLSGQNIIFSEADNYYNFFRTTVLQLLDSAPIDVGISHTKVSNLKHVATFQEKLVVFSDETQFVIKGNELLTPKTINVTPTTEYTALAGVEPLTQGNFIYFPFPRNSYNGVNEYAIDLNTDTFRGEEITGQVPKYIPADIKQLVGSPTEDIIVATTSNGSGTTDLYVYKYFWRGNERVQSAWSKFTFQDDIVNAFFIESDLYLVTEDGTNTHLEKMSLESGLVDTGESYAIHLDKRRAVSGLSPSPSYDAGTDKTTIVAGYPIANAEVWSQGGTKATKDSSSSGNTIVVNGDYTQEPTLDFSASSGGSGASGTISYNSDGTITGIAVAAGGSSYTNGTGFTLTITGGNPTTAATATFDVSGGAVTAITITEGGAGYQREAYVGIPYTSSVTLTRPTVKQSADGNGRSVSGYSHQIVRNGSIEYANTGHFKVSVATKFRSSYEHIFNANILGADTLLGQLVLQDGTFQFPVYANVNDITVTITSESALPMQLLATEFESTVASRSRRIAT